MKLNLSAVLLSLLLLIGDSVSGQKAKYIFDENSYKYLVKDVILSGRDSSGLVILPLHTNDIKDISSTDKEIQYWAILKKYFPDSSTESLHRMVESAPSIQSIRIKGMPNLVYLTYPKNQRLDLRSLEKRYSRLPICRISNFIYSNDGNTCIVFVDLYQSSGFTVELKKSPSGEWNNYIMSTDWLL